MPAKRFDRQMKKKRRKFKIVRVFFNLLFRFYAKIVFNWNVNGERNVYFLLFCKQNDNRIGKKQ